jgi:alkylhydroperoxidase family enzyme
LLPAEAKDTANAEIKKLYEGFETQFGMREVPNVAKALTSSPGLATRVFPLANYFMNQSPLDQRVRELAVLIKRLNCEYGFVRHIDIAKRVGPTQEQVDDIGPYRASSRFDDGDKLILRYAEELTLNSRLNDDLFSKVEDIVGKSNIIELTCAIVFLEHDGAQPQRLGGRTRIVVRAQTESASRPQVRGHVRDFEYRRYTLGAWDLFFALFASGEAVCIKSRSEGVGTSSCFSESGFVSRGFIQSSAIRSSRITGIRS